MGHFTIQLPTGQKADVWRGFARKKQLSLLSLFRGKNLKVDEKIAYIIKIRSFLEGQQEYRLMKTKDGVWVADEDGFFAVENDDQVSLLIKRTIDEYEKLQH